jgi:hypothetical protein
VTQLVFPELADVEPYDRDYEPEQLMAEMNGVHVPRQMTLVAGPGDRVEVFIDGKKFPYHISREPVQVQDFFEGQPEDWKVVTLNIIVASVKTEGTLPPDLEIHYGS